mgnify:CR=1 FL=1
MIELKHIYYTIMDNEKEKTLLNDINCTFYDNCITAITGQNGSGKSTLTKIIMGILSPTSGKIYFNGKDITDTTVDERAKMGITYAFQQPVTFRGITIKELIDIASKEDNSLSKACEYLSRVGICAKDYINREFDKTLSGGEQKRIELALTLAKGGECVIFDEPEAGIDLWSFDKLNEIFEKNICYIVVSHQSRLLKRADKILVLENGKVSNFGNSNEIIDKLQKYKCKLVRED